MEGEEKEGKEGKGINRKFGWYPGHPGQSKLFLHKERNNT